MSRNRSFRGVLAWLLALLVSVTSAAAQPAGRIGLGEAGAAEPAGQIVADIARDIQLRAPAPEDQDCDVLPPLEAGVARRPPASPEARRSAQIRLDATCTRPPARGPPAAVN
jgi:hypothetical protein